MSAFLGDVNSSNGVRNLKNRKLGEAWTDWRAFERKDTRSNPGSASISTVLEILWIKCEQKMRSKRNRLHLARLLGKSKIKKTIFFGGIFWGWLTDYWDKNYSGNTVRQKQNVFLFISLMDGMLAQRTKFFKSKIFKNISWSYHNLKNLVLMLLSKLTTLHWEIWFVSKFCLIITHLLHVFFWQSGHLFIHSIDNDCLVQAPFLHLPIVFPVFV